jgi:Tol biopolymer transport system component
VAYTLSGGQQEDIYIVRLDGSELTRLTNDPAKDRRPVWSPDGRRIAFYSDRSGAYEAWAVNRDGSGLVMVSDMSGTGVASPEWSHDGKSLFITSILGSRGIFRISADAVGGAPDTIPTPSNLPGNIFTAGSQMSPDGTCLAVAYRSGTDIAAGIVELETNTFRQVPGIDAAGTLMWYADSRHLIFDRDGDLVLSDIDSGDQRLLVDPADGNVFQFGSVSNDGRWVYVTLERSEVDIWMMEQE